MPDAIYRIHFGAYRTERDARLVWAGLEAYAGRPLEVMDPSFTRSETESGIVYDVRAGHFTWYHKAESYCARLRERDIACSVVDG